MNQDTVEAGGGVSSSSRKSQFLATVLALFLGGFGTHWFYLRRGDKGKWYLLFCWTLVPTLLSIRDAVRFYRMDNEEFTEVLGGNKSTVSASELPWSDQYWLRLKQYILSLIGLFVLLVIVVGVRVPSEVDGASPEYPLAYAVTMLWVLLLFISPVIVSYLISKDQGELRNYLENVSARRWITVFLFSSISVGLYPLWYIVMRRRRASTVRGLIASGEFDSTDGVTSSPERTARNDGPTNDSGSHMDPSLGQSEISETTPERESKSPRSKTKQESVEESVRTSIEAGDSLRDKARTQLKANNYDEAEQSIENAQKAYKSALENGRKSDKIDESKLRERVDSIKQLQDEVHQARLEDKVTDIEATLDSREANQLGEEDLIAIEDRVEHLNEQVEERGFQDLRGRIEDLENSVATLRERHEQRQLGLPGEISSPPEMSIQYDEFEEIEPIGGGGNADVKKAIVNTDDGPITVAIKSPRLSGTLHTDTVERLLEEAQTWQKLDDHDHIVGVLDYGSDPLPWIAMEYMDAGHLGVRAGELPIEQAYWTALGITKAVRHAHRHGVAHLDLKPENVLFATSANAWDIPKVADWGLSKQLLDHSKSVEGVSPQYAAPEQFDGEYGPVDDMTDVYQLGAVLYELFTGRPPFEGEPTQVMRAILEDQPTPPSEVKPSVPSAVDEILLPALAKEKNERYDSVIYIRDALAQRFNGPM